MSRNKRSHAADFLADDDPEDEDYGKPSPRKKARPTVITKRRPQPKKPRRHSGYKSDDIDDDSDDIIVDTDNSSFASSDEEADTSSPVNVTKAGHRQRSATKGLNFAESSDESEDAIEDSDEEEVVEASERTEQTLLPAGKKSLIAKLKVRTDYLPATQGEADDMRPRRGSKTVKQSTSPTYARPRRSSARISGNEEAGLVALTDSGHHEKVIRPGSAEPVSATARQSSRGGKRLPDTSIIPEESQETEPKTAEEDELNQTVVAASTHEEDDVDMDDEPVTKRGRTTRAIAATSMADEPASTRTKSRRQRGTNVDGESSDFEPVPDEPEDDDESSSSESKSPQKASQRSETSSNGRRSARIREQKASRAQSDEDMSELDHDELAEEARELAASRQSRKRRRQSLEISYDQPKKLRSRAEKVNYNIYRPEIWGNLGEDDDQTFQSAAAVRNRKTGSAYRSLFSTTGPFGVVGGPPVFGEFGDLGAAGAAGGVDSDSSDDEGAQRGRKNFAGIVGMTPTSASAPRGLFNSENVQGTSGAPSNLGKVGDKKALADADPLGVDQNVSFDGVGGLDAHINQLKEMVQLPLLYPEVFQRFHVTPPRGVLFHGPPGTGKTLLARALASSVSSGGRKVTFYMRKGADALSKWVGEAERQLRLLFEEARKNQPSIIFFDEIDGLAPVRSSKQEQIHASIVATLLALMDGMDGRGQVIVIGATNRPDSVDPALRRPGRFDREFYFSLPNEQARRAIIDIHTKGWEPPLEPHFKDRLATLTKGYGGADLRALCTEAALNAVQGTYPQIYQSNEKLIIDPTKIKVLAKDFMISVNRMIPSSERSAPTGAAPLESGVEPLLRDALKKTIEVLNDILPEVKKPTALEEAMFDDRDDENGFDKEVMQQNFDRARVFRPRMLVYGVAGMGQHYIASALLNKMERLHVQSLDLSVLYGDTTRSPEAAVVQLFAEARRHKPSVIYIPNVDIWYNSVGQSVIRLFTGLLRSVPPNEPVLLLGVMNLEASETSPDKAMLADLFPFSKKSHVELLRPSKDQRREYFSRVTQFINSSPTEFPQSENRKKREIVQLEVAPSLEQPKKEPSKAELKAQKKHDRHMLNYLKIRIQPVMDHIKKQYGKFRNPPIDPTLYPYLFTEQDPRLVSTDLNEEQRQLEQYRPYELSKDKKGAPGIIEVSTGKFYYNLEIITIERRLSNGYYKRPKDFLADIKRLAKDAATLGDQDRTLKANVMVSNVEVDMQMIETSEPNLVKECENIYLREEERERLQAEREEQALKTGQEVPQLNPNVPPHVSTTTTDTSGPVVLGERIPGPSTLPRVAIPRDHVSNGDSLSNGHTSRPASSGQRLSNGSTEPPQHDEDDVQMTDSPSTHNHDTQNSSTNNSLPNTQVPKSQKSAFMSMAQNSQPGDYHNSASTTSSGQKTSDPSGSTQSTNGVGRSEHPDFSGAYQLSGGSQLPDTQEMVYAPSQSQASPESQTSVEPMGPPSTVARQHTSIGSLLNNPTTESEGPRTESSGPQTITADNRHLQDFHAALVSKTSGCSVEQLEQLNAAMMDMIWRKREAWNRNIVLFEVMRVFNQTISDIEAMQVIQPNSQDKKGI